MFAPMLDLPNSYEAEEVVFSPSAELRQLLDILKVIDLQQASMAFAAH